MMIENIFGEKDYHTVEWKGECNGQVRIHTDLQAPLNRLIASAKTEGINLAVASGYRSFDRQVQIWNEKCLGKRPVLDEQGQPFVVDKMKDEELVPAILRWSALPGASRHHWGTDLDVYDAAAIPPGYQVKLETQELEKYFQRLESWFQVALLPHYFFRPYQTDRSGISPEWWHISYLPIATQYEEKLTYLTLREKLERSDFERKQYVLNHLEELFHRFVVNFDRSPIR